ncbi:hypothetical protein GC089_04825 [Cellulomonas sp. JZ18]|uniref:hypothetical protein n=1 Tax=Cellulomonas sp. JZ18 TaxID=2654191 RepID=UPI0012D3FCC4|nr:hypothetical protein [Cellulomonas sp. JZ18]QGQ18695.1 hypothetical protein GC089_04825 [Cellulomonas sp. JZ18]
MRRGRGAGTAALVVAVVLPVAACTAAPQSRGDVSAAPAVAAVHAEASCLLPDVLRALALDPASAVAASVPASAAAVERGTPPDGFVADTVLVCGRGQPLRDSAGTWHSVTSTRLEGDLTDVLAAVGPVRTAAACEDGPAPQVWLLDALDGGVLLPADVACGGAGDGLTAALAELDVVRATEEPVDLVVPATDGSPGPGAPGARTAGP